MQALPPSSSHYDDAGAARRNILHRNPTSTTSSASDHVYTHMRLHDSDRIVDIEAVTDTDASEGGAAPMIVDASLSYGDTTLAPTNQTVAYAETSLTTSARQLPIYDSVSVPMD